MSRRFRRASQEIKYKATKSLAQGPAGRYIKTVGILNTSGSMSNAPMPVTTSQISQAQPGANPIAGRYSTSNLSYPLDVGDDPQQGHHIIFEIDEINKGKIKALKEARANIRRIEKNLAGGHPSALGVGNVNKMSNEAIVGFNASKALVASQTASGSGPGRSLTMSKLPTTRSAGFIALYMPASVKVNYAADYGEEEIGVVAEGGSDIIEAFMQGKDSKETTLNLLDQAATGIKQMATKALDAVAPGAKHMMALNEGKVITPRMELMFKGIGRRDFSFEFSFLPKSEQEAIAVEKIIHKFKFHMASNFTAGAEGVRKMDIPDHFNIRYMYHNSENFHLNRISTCVLKGMDVEYGGDRFVAYGDGRPQQTKLSLSFQELEIITKSDIEVGY